MPFMMTTPFLRQLHSSFIRFYSDGWPALGAMDNLRAASRELTYCQLRIRLTCAVK